ncbi:hypothetical protein RF11_14131 [Thelohanellus kitauei]|uniref:Uncharacterized protein n=1 Tax=Thelohanellus kitauei TaxID=669202 RepID=A0A0C2MYG2_THEKT|nr:hypothetical protein RF11_14131 [Thelohanellus kitauei]
MTCNVSELLDKLEIGGCYISAVHGRNQNITEIIYRSKHRFAINTTYEFSDFDIMFENYLSVDHRIIINLKNLVIEFPYTNNICRVNNEYLVTVVVNLDSTKTIYHTVCVGAKYFSEAHATAFVVIMILLVIILIFGAVKSYNIKSQARNDSHDLT